MWADDDDPRIGPLVASRMACLSTRKASPRPPSAAASAVMAGSLMPAPSTPAPRPPPAGGRPRPASYRCPPAHDRPQVGEAGPQQVGLLAAEAATRAAMAEPVEPSRQLHLEL